MRVRDLFVLVLKVVALSLGIHAVLLNIPSLVMRLWMDQDVWGTNGIELLHTVLLVGLLVLLFVFAEKIVDCLKVEQGFTNPTIPTEALTLDGLTQLGLFFVGLGLIVDHLPSFLSNALFWFKAKAVDNPYEYVQTGNYWFVSLFNLFVGFWLIRNKEKVSQWVLPKEEKKG